MVQQTLPLNDDTLLKVLDLSLTYLLRRGLFENPEIRDLHIDMVWKLALWDRGCKIEYDALLEVQVRARRAYRELALLKKEK